jgi:hypothetical protein
METLRAGVNLWASTSPRGVIISALRDAKSRLPGIAARGLEIPTFSLPHGAVPVPSVNLESVGFALYSLNIQKIANKDAGLPTQKHMAGRASMAIREYAKQSHRNLFDNKA